MFVKLFNQILDSSIADNRRLRHFFTDLLLCADMRGYVVMTESAIARRIGTSVDEVEWGIAELEKPDPRSKTPDNEGRRIEKLDGSGYGWRIINFETYKALKSAEDLREKTKERVRNFRAKNKLQTCNADVTPCNAGNAIKRQIEIQIETEKKTEVEEEERDATLFDPAPVLSDKFPTQTANDLQAVIERIRRIKPGWNKAALTYEELQSVSKNASCLLSITEGDWAVMGKFMSARLAEGDASWQPRFRKQFIENAPDVIQHASNWAYKTGNQSVAKRPENLPSQWK